MKPKPKPGRENQRLRARKDLLQAAARLLQAGHTPTMDEIAEEAMVSRATAYRYFPNLNALLIEAPVHAVAPTAAALFEGDTSTDAAQRADKAEAALHAMCYANETQLRLMLAQSLQDRVSVKGKSKTPPRQNRRAELIAAALAPARKRIGPAAYARLCAALSLVFGTESMIVFRDVLPLSPTEARRVKSWAIRTLVDASLAK